MTKKADELTPLEVADLGVEEAKKTGDPAKIRRALFKWGSVFLDQQKNKITLRPDNNRMTLGDLIMLQDADDPTYFTDIFGRFLVDPETDDYMEDQDKAGGVIAQLTLAQLEKYAELFADSFQSEADPKKVT